MSWLNKYAEGGDNKPFRRSVSKDYTKEVQRTLNEKYGTTLKVDGVWGPLTENAYQQYWDDPNAKKTTLDKVTSVKNNNDLRAVNIDAAPSVTTSVALPNKKIAAKESANVKEEAKRVKSEMKRLGVTSPQEVYAQNKIEADQAAVLNRPNDTLAPVDENQDYSTWDVIGNPMTAIRTYNDYGYIPKGFNQIVENDRNVIDTPLSMFNPVQYVNAAGRVIDAITTPETYTETLPKTFGAGLGLLMNENVPEDWNDEAFKTLGLVGDAALVQQGLKGFSDASRGLRNLKSSNSITTKTGETFDDSKDFLDWYSKTQNNRPFLKKEVNFLNKEIKDRGILEVQRSHPLNPLPKLTRRMLVPEDYDLKKVAKEALPNLVNSYSKGMSSIYDQYTMGPGRLNAFNQWLGLPTKGSMYRIHPESFQNGNRLLYTTTDDAMKGIFSKELRSKVPASEDLIPLSKDTFTELDVAYKMANKQPFSKDLKALGYPAVKTKKQFIDELNISPTKNPNVIIDWDKYTGTAGGVNWIRVPKQGGGYKWVMRDTWDIQPFSRLTNAPKFVRDTDVSKLIGSKNFDVNWTYNTSPKFNRIESPYYSGSQWQIKKEGGDLNFIVDPKGQWAHPGKPTMIPTDDGRITMEGVQYPVLGIDDQGNQQMMYPGMDYVFPGRDVYEIPQFQTAGQVGGPKIIQSGNGFEYGYSGDDVMMRPVGKSNWVTIPADKAKDFKSLMPGLDFDVSSVSPDFKTWQKQGYDELEQKNQEDIKIKRAETIQKNKFKVSPTSEKIVMPTVEEPLAAPVPITNRYPGMTPSEPTLFNKPAIADALPTFASAITGVEYPEIKEGKVNKEVIKYSADPEFQMMPYKDTETAITEYQKTPTYKLRYKNMSDYSPDDLTQVQSYLDKNGYFPERKKQINIDEYETPDQIIELQKYLVKEGLIDVLGINNDSPNGELSGKLDKNTRTAIEQYNMYNKKFKQGELDDSTKDAIRQFQNKTDAKNTIGVPIADPFDLYDPKTGEPNVELTNKAMQKFEEDLMKRGFFTGNVKYDISSKASENPRIAFNFTLNPDPTTAFGHCAQYVNGTVCKDDVVGEEAREELGFKGSAWQISENLQNKGGSLVFAGLPERSQIKLGDANEINNYLKTTLTSDQAKKNLQEMIGSGNVWSGSAVKPGDIVNIFFEGSSYTKEAYNQTAPLNNRFFTTHVGIVKADDQGNLYVEHNVHGKVEKDKLQDFAEGKIKGNGKNKVSLIAGITRPNYFDGVDNDGRIPAAGIPYYQTEYGQFNPAGALANKEDYAGKSISGENTYKFLSTIEKNKDAILKDIPITENEFGKLMRIARVIPTLETQAGTGADYEAEPNALIKGMQDVIMPEREKSMGITSLKDETNINPQLRSKLYESDYDLADPAKAGLPTFYVLSKNYLYLKEVANEYGLSMTSDQLAKLAGLSYNQSIGKVAAELIQNGGYDNYIKYRRETATEGKGNFKYHGAIDLYDKQTMKYGGWLNKYQSGGPKEELSKFTYNPDINAYIMRRIQGAPIMDLDLSELAKIPTSAWRTYLSDAEQIAKNDLAIDNMGMNVYYNTNDKTFKFIDLSPGVTPNMDPYWRDSIIGGISKNLPDKVLREKLTHGMMGQYDRAIDHQALRLYDNLPEHLAQEEKIKYVGDLLWEIKLKRSGVEEQLKANKYQDGGNMPFDLPLKSSNPGSPWAYESPQANGYLLPDVNRPELLNTGATEYKMGVDDVTIPTVVDGNYMAPDQAYQRYLLTGENFKPMVDPRSYSEFYNTAANLGLMKQADGGGVFNNNINQKHNLKTSAEGYYAYINGVTLSEGGSPKGWLDKHK